MNQWLVIYQSNEPKSLWAPDGTVIEVYPDKNIIITPDGHRMQIDIYPPGFRVLDRVNHNNGKQIYKKLKENNKC